MRQAVTHFDRVTAMVLTMIAAGVVVSVELDGVNITCRGLARSD
jgi:hypothetical protein